MYDSPEWYDYKRICPECGHLMNRCVNAYEFWGQEEKVVVFECPNCGYNEEQ